jgi:hypothetical protein
METSRIREEDHSATTANPDRRLRLWTEVSRCCIDFDAAQVGTQVIAQWGDHGAHIEDVLPVVAQAPPSIRSVCRMHHVAEALENWPGVSGTRPGFHGRRQLESATLDDSGSRGDRLEPAVHVGNALRSRSMTFI